MRPAKTQISQVWSVFAVHMKKPRSLAIHWAHREDWAEWADPSLRWAHSHFAGFVMLRLICSWSWVLKLKHSYIIRIFIPYVQHILNAKQNLVPWHCAKFILEKKLEQVFMKYYAPNICLPLQTIWKQCCFTIQNAKVGKETAKYSQNFAKS